MKWEHWQGANGCMLCEEGRDKSLDAWDTSEENLDLAFEADTYEEAQQKHYDLHDWGTYVPMEPQEVQYEL